MRKKYPPIKAEFLSHEAINKSTEKFLKKYNNKNKTPLPIEQIIEFDLKINIVPVCDFKANYDIEGSISYDMTIIYVDEYLYNNYENRYRFTLAHEIGHLILHKHIIQSFEPGSISDWEKIYQRADLSNYSWLEWQAYEFAGLLLVPKNELVPLFNREIKKIKRKIKEIKSYDLPDDTYKDHVVEVMILKFQSKFEVSHEVLRRRISKEITLENISVP